MGQRSRVNVAVAVAENARDNIGEVAAACRALGFAHTATLSAVGVLTGSVELAELANLAAIPGVLAVEVECDATSRVSAQRERRRRLN